MYEDLTEELKEELIQAREVISNTPLDHKEATNYIKNLGQRERNQDKEKYRMSARMSIAQGRFTQQARQTVDFRQSALFKINERPSTYVDHELRLNASVKPPDVRMYGYNEAEDSRPYKSVMPEKRAQAGSDDELRPIASVTPPKMRPSNVWSLENDVDMDVI